MTKQTRFLVTAIAAVGVLAAAAEPVRASVARRTPDFARTLISTDVGDERWAITWNDAEDGTITGNVFFSDDREPAFLWCEDITNDGEVDSVSFSCFGADACLASPCLLSQWDHVQDVTVPVSFFDTPNLEWLSTGDPVTLPLSFLSPPEEGDDGTRSSGVQITIDDERVLINKNIGRERWAITRNVDDKTLTGNIFTTADADPSFIWCSEVSFDAAAGEVTYACSVPGTNPPPPPPPPPTPDPFKRAQYSGPWDCDKYRRSFPRVFGHAFPGKNFGTCWQCPAGFDRSLLPIDGDAACLKGGFVGIGADYEPATRIGQWGCTPPSFRDGLTDDCYVCPSNYRYDDTKDIDDEMACYYDPR